MSRGFLRDPQFQMREDHVNPQMRPSVNALMSKLRKLTPLKAKPEAVEFIVNDMIFWHLVRNEQHPDILWRIISRNMYRFTEMMNGLEKVKALPPSGQTELWPE